jgi:hypothetical protein
MPSYTITIPTIQQAQRLVEAINGLYPPERDDDGNPLYTPTQWARIWIKDNLINVVNRYENKLAKDAAAVERDETLASIT